MSRRTTDLEQAYKSEKDAKIKVRILGVMLVLEDDMGVPQAARTIRCSENSIHNWIRRFAEAGTDGLRDLPRSGRPTLIPKKKMDVIMDQESKYDTNPFILRRDIKDVTGVWLSLGHVRKIMKRHGLSRRKVQKVHVNHASADTVRAWQWYLENVRIPRLKSDGFTVVAADEAFFVQSMHDAYVWGPIGTRSVAPYSGDRTSIAVFGCIAEDGRQMFRTYTCRFRSAQFIECLEYMRLKFGRVAVLCDRWSVHTSADVRYYLAGHPDVKIIRLPRGSPYLNVVEACWHRGKLALLGTMIYGTVDTMRRSISEYYRTTMFTNLSLYTYLYRSPTKALKYL